MVCIIEGKRYTRNGVRNVYRTQISGWNRWKTVICLLGGMSVSYITGDGGWWWGWQLESRLTVWWSSSTAPDTPSCIISSMWAVAGRTSSSCSCPAWATGPSIHSRFPLSLSPRRLPVSGSGRLPRELEDFHSKVGFLAVAGAGGCGWCTLVQSDWGLFSRGRKLMSWGWGWATTWTWPSLALGLLLVIRFTFILLDHGYVGWITYHHAHQHQHTSHTWIFI